MTFEATTTAYGEPAVQLLSGQVATLKAGDPLAPVTVIVPSNYVAVAVRRALAAQKNGIANVTFLTLHRLAERLGAAVLAGAGRRPVSAPVITAAVRGVLDDDPGRFETVADHPATQQALAAAHRELRTAPDGALDAVAACSARASDVIRIHRVVRARLDADWHDEEDLLAVAAAQLRAGTAPDLGPVVVHLVPDLTAGGADLLRALAARAPLRVNIPVTGEPTADAPVLAAHARAGIVPAGDIAVEPPCAKRILSASDPDDEVRAAVRLVSQWMYDGVPLGRMAMVYAGADPYARIVHEQLSAAGIRVNGTPVRVLGDMLLGRTLRSLLSLPDRGFRRSDVLGVLAGAPLLDGQAHVPSRAWERVSRDAGVVAGSDWDERLAVYAQEQRRVAEHEERDGIDGRPQRRRRDADRADALAGFVDRLGTDLAAGSKAGSWAALVTWTRELIARYLGDERRRSGWPADERTAADRVEEALDRLAGLDALEGPTPTVLDFRRALDSELDAALPREGHLGEGVLVGPVSIASGLVLDRIAVLGLAEGRYPPRRLEDPLLPDAERAAAGGALRLRTDLVHDDRRQLLAAVASAKEAVLCHPRGDLRRSGERPASRWLLADAAKLARLPAVDSSDVPRLIGHAWFEHVASFAGGLTSAPVLATAQELRLAAIARGVPHHRALRDDRTVQLALDVVRSRRSGDFTRFDGNLAAVAADIGRPGRVSATGLESWAACPHAYFLHHLLGVEPVDEPERRLQIDHLDRGKLVHAILDGFVRGALERGHPVTGWSKDDRARLHEIAETQFLRFESEGRTGHPLFWRRDRGRLLAELDGFLDADAARLAGGMRPLASEHRFAGLAIALPNGHVVQLGGSIDRVDRATDGSLVVLDYKTGSDSRYTGLSEDRPHDHGTKLQLYIYAAAARDAFGPRDPVEALYWFTVDNRFIGYPVTAAVKTDVEAAITAIVDGIAAGVFPARPSEKPGWNRVDCWYCTPDGLSGADRRREWERKRDDPALAGYVALCGEGSDDHE